MSVYDDKPWLGRYDEGQPADIEVEYATALELFQTAVRRAPDADVVRYFDGRISYRELDALTDAFAVGITEAGFTPGERVAIFTQNVPQFVIAQQGLPPHFGREDGSSAVVSSTSPEVIPPAVTLGLDRPLV